MNVGSGNVDARGAAEPLAAYTHWCPDIGPAMLAESCAVMRNDSDTALPVEEFDRRAMRARAICYFVPDHFDARRIARFPNLAVLAGFGKGYDNIDVAAATERNIWVTNVPAGLTEATADLAWALLMAVARNIVPADRFMRTGAFTGWHPRNFLGANVHGKTLGLVGFGEIGRALARRARGFSMRVLYADLVRAAAAVEAEFGAAHAGLDELLTAADFTVVCAPLDARTYHLFDRERLRAMRPHAFLVNVARGSLVDEDAVAAALRAGALAGYAADVFEFEDRQIAARPRRISEALLACDDRVVLSAHLGTAVLETREELARVQARSVLEVLRGERPAAAVNEISR